MRRSIRSPRRDFTVPSHSNNDNVDNNDVDFLMKLLEDAREERGQNIAKIVELEGDLEVKASAMQEYLRLTELKSTQQQQRIRIRNEMLKQWVEVGTAMCALKKDIPLKSLIENTCELSPDMRAVSQNIYNNINQGDYNNTPVVGGISLESLSMTINKNDNNNNNEFPWIKSNQSIFPKTPEPASPGSSNNSTANKKNSWWWWNKDNNNENKQEDFTIEGGGHDSRSPSPSSLSVNVPQTIALSNNDENNLSNNEKDLITKLNNTIQLLEKSQFELELANENVSSLRKQKGELELSLTEQRRATDRALSDALENESISKTTIASEKASRDKAETEMRNARYALEELKAKMDSEIQAAIRPAQEQALIAQQRANKLESHLDSERRARQAEEESSRRDANRRQDLTDQLVHRIETNHREERESLSKALNEAQIARDAAVADRDESLYQLKKSNNENMQKVENELLRVQEQYQRLLIKTDADRHNSVETTHNIRDGVRESDFSSLASTMQKLQDSQVDTNKAHRAELLAATQKLDSERDKAEREKSELKKSLEHAQLELQEVTSREEGLRKKISDMMNDKSHSLSTQKEELEDQYRLHIDNNEKKIKELEDAVKEHENKVEKVTRELNEKDKILVEKEKEITVKEKELEEQQQLQQQLRLELNQAQNSGPTPTTVSTPVSDDVKIDEEKDNLLKRITILEEEITSLKNDKEKLSNDLAGAQSAYASASSELANAIVKQGTNDISSDIDNKRDTSNEITDEITTDQQKQVIQQQELLQQLQHQLQEEQQKQYEERAGHGKEIEEIRQQCRQLEGDIATRDIDLHAAQEQLATAREQLQLLKERLEAAETDLNTARKQLGSTQEQLELREELEDEVKKLQRRLKRKEEEITQLTEDLEVSNDQISKYRQERGAQGGSPVTMVAASSSPTQPLQQEALAMSMASQQSYTPLLETIQTQARRLEQTVSELAAAHNDKGRLEQQLAQTGSDLQATRSETSRYRDQLALKEDEWTQMRRDLAEAEALRDASNTEIIALKDEMQDVRKDGQQARHRVEQLEIELEKTRAVGRGVLAKMRQLEMQADETKILRSNIKAEARRTEDANSALSEARRQIDSLHQQHDRLVQEARKAARVDALLSQVEDLQGQLSNANEAYESSRQAQDVLQAALQEARAAALGASQNNAVEDISHLQPDLESTHIDDANGRMSPLGSVAGSVVHGSPIYSRSNSQAPSVVSNVRSRTNSFAVSAVSTITDPFLEMGRGEWAIVKTTIHRNELGLGLTLEQRDVDKHSSHQLDAINTEGLDAEFNNDTFQQALQEAGAEVVIGPDHTFTIVHVVGFKKPPTTIPKIHQSPGRDGIKKSKNHRKDSKDNNNSKNSNDDEDLTFNFEGSHPGHPNHAILNPALTCNPPLQLGDVVVGVANRPTQTIASIVSAVQGLPDSDVPLIILRRRVPVPPGSLVMTPQWALTMQETLKALRQAVPELKSAFAITNDSDDIDEGWGDDLLAEIEDGSETELGTIALRTARQQQLMHRVVPSILESASGLFSTLREELDVMVQAVTDQEEVLQKNKNAQETMMAEVAAMNGEIHERTKQEVEKYAMRCAELEQQLDSHAFDNSPDNTKSHSHNDTNNKELFDKLEAAEEALQFEQSKVEQLNLILEQTRAMSKALVQNVESERQKNLDNEGENAIVLKEQIKLLEVEYLQERKRADDTTAALEETMRVGKDLIRQCEEAKAKARTNDSLRLRLGELQIENDELRDEKSQLQADLNTSVEQGKDVDAMRSSLSKALEKARSEGSRLLSKAQASLQKEREERMDVERERASLQEDVDQMSEHMEDLKVQLDNTKQAGRDLLQRLKDSQAANGPGAFRHAARLANMEKSIADETKRADDALEIQKNLKEEIGTLKRDQVMILEGMTEQHNKALESLKKELEEMKKQAEIAHNTAVDAQEALEKTMSVGNDVVQRLDQKNNEEIRLQNQIELLNNQLIKASSDRDDALQKYSDLHSEFADKYTKIQEDLTSKYSSRHDDVLSKCSKLEDELVTVKSSARELLAKFEKIDSERRDKISECDNQLQLIDQMERAIEGLQRENRAAQSDLERAAAKDIEVKRLNDEINQKNARINSLKMDLELAVEKLDSYTETDDKLKTVKASAQTLLGRYESVVKECAKLREEHEEMYQRLEENNSVRTTMEDEMSSLRETAAALAEKHGEVLDQLQEEQQRSQILSERYDAMKASFDDHLEGHTQLETVATTAANELLEQSNKLASTQSVLKETRAEGKKAAVRLKDVSRQASTLEGENQKLSSALSAIQQELESYQESNEQKDIALKEAEESIIQLQPIVESERVLKEKNITLTDQIQQLTSDLDEVQSTKEEVITQMETDKKELLNQIDNMNVELSNMTEFQTRMEESEKKSARLNEMLESTRDYEKQMNEQIEQLKRELAASEGGEALKEIQEENALKIEIANKKVDDMQKQLESAENRLSLERERGRLDLDRLQVQLENERAKLSLQVEEEQELIKSERKVMEGSMKKMRDELDLSLSELTSLQESASKTRQDLNTARQKIKELENAAVLVVGTTQRLESEIERLKGDLDDSEDLIRSKDDEIDNAYKKLAASESSKIISEMDKQNHDAAQQDISLKRAEIQTLRDDLKRIKSQSSDTERIISELDNQLNDEKKANQSLNQELEQSKRDINENKELINVKNEMIAAIKEECQRLKRQTDEENTVQLKGDLVSLRATLQEREKDIEDYNQSITQLRHRLEESASTSIDDRVKAAEIAEAELLQKLESMNDQANNNQKEIKSLESKLRNTMSQLLQAQQQVRQEQARADRASTAFAAYKFSSDGNSRGNNNNSANKSVDLLEQIMDLAAERQRLTDELKEERERNDRTALMLTQQEVGGVRVTDQIIDLEKRNMEAKAEAKKQIEDIEKREAEQKKKTHKAKKLIKNLKNEINEKPSEVKNTNKAIKNDKKKDGKYSGSGTTTNNNSNNNTLRRTGVVSMNAGLTKPTSSSNINR